MYKPVYYNNKHFKTQGTITYLHWNVNFGGYSWTKRKGTSFLSATDLFPTIADFYRRLCNRCYTNSMHTNADKASNYTTYI